MWSFASTDDGLIYQSCRSVAIPIGPYTSPPPSCLVRHCSRARGGLATRGACLRRLSVSSEMCAVHTSAGVSPAQGGSRRLVPRAAAPSSQTEWLRTAPLSLLPSRCSSYLNPKTQFLASGLLQRSPVVKDPSGNWVAAYPKLGNFHIKPLHVIRPFLLLCEEVQHLKFN